MICDDVSVLLIDDDAMFAEELTQFLTQQGLHLRWISTLTDIVAEVARFGPDIVLLDQFVGNHDSLSVLAQLRHSTDAGMIMLTGNMDMTDRIVALECGADDFVLKASGPRELFARIGAVLRRIRRGTEADSGRDGQARPVRAQPGPLSMDSIWHVDVRMRQVHAPDGTEVALSAMMFDALVLLAGRGGRVVTRMELSLRLLGRSHAPADRTVDNLVSGLRRRLMKHSPGQAVVRSVRGQGYAFTLFAVSPTDASHDAVLAGRELETPLDEGARCATPSDEARSQDISGDSNAIRSTPDARRRSAV